MYVDIHNHVLPGIDDGAISVDDSRLMLERYVELGFRTVVATPHHEVHSIVSDQSNTANVWKEVSDLGEAMGLTMLRGSEIRLSPDISMVQQCLTESTLGESSYLLVDFRSGSWPFYAEDALFQTQMLGFRPVLAHPERYGWGNETVSIGKKLVERGVALQLTLASFTGMFGRDAESSAIMLMDRGLVHLLATDAHGPGRRLGVADEAIDRVRSRYSQRAVSLLLEENPLAMLADQEMTFMSSVRKSLFGRLRTFGRH